MIRPSIGALRTRLTLETPVDTPDGADGFTRTWTPVADVFARVVPGQGARDFVADSMETRITHRVTVRDRADIANGMRFVEGARALLILAVIDPDGRGRHLECRCEEFAP